MMINEEFKKELMWRYKFIYENIEYLVGPFLICNPFDEEIDYVVNRRIPFDLLVLGKKFLLNDGCAEFGELVKYVEKRKRNLAYVKDINIKTEKYNDKAELVWQYFNSISNLIMHQEQNKILRRKKLLAMNEYYKILNYQNKTGVQKSDSKLISRYLENKNNSWISFFASKKEEDKLKNCNFIRYLSDKRNYDLESMGILSTKEKQEIYLGFHDELAWDMIIKCEVDKDTIYKPKKKHLLKQDINPPCQEEFYIVESKIFINPNDDFSDYYQVCPNCGYVVNIPHKLLPDKVRTRIEERCLNDENEFSSQLLKAELRSIDYRDDILIKRRIKN